MSTRSFSLKALWRPQREAVEFIKARLRALSISRFVTADHVQSILVRMPTGTGKSGVIATVCQTDIVSGRVLVLTPSEALRDQLANDIDARFWRHANVKPPATANAVFKFRPSTARSVLKNAPASCAFVATIQTLEDIWRKNEKLHAKVAREIECVIVDEGHREPADQWSAAVRGLRRPVILFTATPYRNDHRVFNVGRGDAFAYTHAEAEKERYVRKLRFKTLETGDSPSSFAEKLVAFYKSKEFKALVPRDAKPPRVIVRCDRSEAIKAVAERLVELKQAVVAIHTGLPNTGIYRKRVPREPEDESARRDPALDAIFWVHQNILLEGIDRSECCLLALYEPPKNGRSLVQQIGRILRNPRRIRDASAVVFSSPAHLQKEMWKVYRKYEVEFESNPDLYEKRELFDATITLTPQTWLYEGGLYRGRLDIEAGPTARQIMYPVATHVFRTQRAFNPEKFSERMLEDLGDADFDVRPRRLPDGSEVLIESPDDNTWFIPFVIYRSPRFLSEHYLLQFDIGFALWRVRGRHLLFTSSEVRIPAFFDEFLRREDPERLRKLFHGKEDAWLTEVSLLNTDLGAHSVRR